MVTRKVCRRNPGLRSCRKVSSPTALLASDFEISPVTTTVGPLNAGISLASPISCVPRTQQCATQTVQLGNLQPLHGQRVHGLLGSAFVTARLRYVFSGIAVILTMGVLRRCSIAKVGEPVIEIDASVKDL